MASASEQICGICGLSSSPAEMICPRCGTIFPENEVECQSCGKIYDSYIAMCPSCGGTLEEEPSYDAGRDGAVHRFRLIPGVTEDMAGKL